MKTKFISILIPVLGTGMINAQTFINENFNTGIPSSWTVVTALCGNSNGDSTRWEGTTNGWRGNGLSNSLDSTEFAVVDSDLPGTFCNADEQVITPVINAGSASSLFLEFDMIYKTYLGDYGNVDVFDGSSWVTVAGFTANIGTWMTPNHQTIDITSYINPNLQVRFRYVANWDWYWALDNVNIYTPAAFPVTVSTADPLCYGDCNGSATATPNGGVSPYTYLWNDPGTQTTQTATGLCAGTYLVTVVDNIGDSVINQAVITDPQQMTIVDSVINPLCAGNTNGSATAYVSGGTTPYTYAWSNGPSTPLNSSIGAGTYTLYVTDVNSCSTGDTVVLSEPPAITMSTSISDVACHGDSTGAVSVAVSGGVPSYSYLWNTGDTLNALQNIPTGNYSVTVTDANNCMVWDTMIVTEPPAIVLALSSTPDDASCNGSATVNVTGGISPYTYLWSDSSTTDSVSALCAGNYCVTITDVNACTSDTCVDVSVGFGETDRQSICAIYPNPGNGHFKLLVKIGSNEMVKCVVTDVTGRRMSEQVFESGAGVLNYDLSSLPAGHYVIAVTGFKWRSVHQVVIL